MINNKARRRSHNSSLYIFDIKFDIKLYKINIYTMSDMFFFYNSSFNLRRYIIETKIKMLC